MKKIVIIVISILLAFAFVMFLLVNNKGKYVLVSYDSEIFDNSYTEYIWDGINSLNVRSDYIDIDERSFNERLIEAIERKSAKIVVCSETNANTDMINAARENEDVVFVNFDVNFNENELENLVGITFDMYDVSYLAGYIAGKTTKTNKVGFIGGVENDTVKEYEKGFTDGLKRANENIELTVKYIGSYNNAESAQHEANIMYTTNNIDIIYQVAGSSGLGVITSAKNNNKYVIGSELDQTSLAPDSVLTSTVKNVNFVFSELSENYKKGEIKQNYHYDLINNGVDIVKTDLISEELYQEVLDLKEELKNK